MIKTLLLALNRRLTTPPAHLSGRATQAFAAVNSAIGLGLACHGLFLILFLVLDQPALAAFNVGSVLLFAGLFFVAIPRGRLDLATAVASIEVVAHAWVATALLGWGSGFHYYIILLAPMWFMLTSVAIRTRAALALTPSVLYVLLYLVFGGPVSSGLSVDQLRAFHVMNMAAFSVVLAALALYFAWSVSTARAALALELRRSESLLLNVLPSSIADRLKDESGSIADGFEACSVLFADIVGFTPLSARLPPQALVSMLNEVFSEFDMLAAAEGVEKIKTIGDAYMAAAGIPEPVADHAQRIARMGLQMLGSVQRLRADIGMEISLRIGIHSGPAVAGVIGRSKFIYDLWGDTVNTAARMESQGIPGEVQITAETARLLQGEFAIESRGMQEIKGKGQMETFILRALAPEPE